MAFAIDLPLRCATAPHAAPFGGTHENKRRKRLRGEGRRSGLRRACPHRGFSPSALPCGAFSELELAGAPLAGSANTIVLDFAAERGLSAVPRGGRPPRQRRS